MKTRGLFFQVYAVCCVLDGFIQFSI